jgi:hypothetical protein
MFFAGIFCVHSFLAEAAKSNEYFVCLPVGHCDGGP